MAKFSVLIDMNASMTLHIEAKDFEEAEKKAKDAIWDEDALIDQHRNDIFIWNPDIDEIIEEEE